MDFWRHHPLTFFFFDQEVEAMLIMMLVPPLPQATGRALWKWFWQDLSSFTWNKVKPDVQEVLSYRNCRVIIFLSVLVEIGCYQLQMPPPRPISAGNTPPSWITKLRIKLQALLCSLLQNAAKEETARMLSGSFQNPSPIIINELLPFSHCTFLVHFFTRNVQLAHFKTDWAPIPLGQFSLTLGIAIRF